MLEVSVTFTIDAHHLHCPLPAIKAKEVDRIMGAVPRHVIKSKLRRHI